MFRFSSGWEQEFYISVGQALARCSKSLIEKRKRNLNFFSPFSRRERESDFLVSMFERRKRNYENILHFREEKVKWIFFSQGSRREREILKKHSPLSRREREIDFLFSRFEKRARNSKKDSSLSRRERDFIVGPLSVRPRRGKILLLLLVVVVLLLVLVTIGLSSNSV